MTWGRNDLGPNWFGQVGENGQNWVSYLKSRTIPDFRYTGILDFRDTRLLFDFSVQKHNSGMLFSQFPLRYLELVSKISKRTENKFDV